MSDEFAIKTMLKEHIEASNKWREDASEKLAKIEVHHDYTKTKLNLYEEQIADLKGNQNKALGALALIGTALSAFFAWIFSKIVQ